MNRRAYKKEKKKSSKKRKFLTVSLIVIGSLLISLSTYAVFLTKKAETAADKAFEIVDNRDQSPLRDEKVEPLNDNVSVLFIGIDDSEQRGQGDTNSRSDALMLATLNNKTKTVKLVSVPRDSYVYIDEVGYEDKITHAHSYGGTRASIETIEDLLEVPVDYYVKMNFDAFIDVIDALGGIEAEVPYKLLEKDENDQRTVALNPGLQELNGREALALARTRKLDNDIERGKRQQMILSSIIKKASSASSFTKYGEVIDAVGENMKTDLTFDEMKSFFEYIKKGMPQIDTLSLEGYDDMSTGVYYWKLDDESLDETRDILKSHLGLQPETSNISGNNSDKSSNYAADSRP